MNIDLLNAFRFANHGVDMHQQPTQGMDEALFNALAFVQANPIDNIAAWVTTEEWATATQESIAAIIGTQHWEFPTSNMFIYQ